MTLFDGKIITATYTSNVYDVIEILYYGEGGATSYIIENNPLHPDFKTLVENGWDADAIQKATEDKKRKEAKAFNEMLEPHIQARIAERIGLIDKELKNKHIQSQEEIQNLRLQQKSVEIQQRFAELREREAEIHRIADERHEELTQREADMQLSAEERLEEFNKREMQINSEYAKIDTSYKNLDKDYEKIEAAHKDLDNRQTELEMTSEERLEEFNKREAEIHNAHKDLDNRQTELEMTSEERLEEFNKREAEIHRIADERHVEVAQREKDLDLTAEERLEEFNKREAEIHRIADERHVEVSQREKDLDLTAEERYAAFEEREKLIQLTIESRHEEIDMREERHREEQDKRMAEIKDHEHRVSAELEQRLELRRSEIERDALAKGAKILEQKQKMVGKLDKSLDDLSLQNLQLDKQIKLQLFDYISEHAQDKNTLFEFKLWAMEDNDVKSSPIEVRKKIRKCNNLWVGLSALADVKTSNVL
jgi:hypothetical protein